MIIIQIAGRLGKDPESRFIPSGQKVTTFNVATNSRKGGKDETVWIRVTVWGDRFDKMISFLKKGSAIRAIGEMGKPEIWTDKEGRPQVSVEMTADILKFSPSNTPDGAKSEGSQQGAVKSQSSTPGYGNDNSFADAEHLGKPSTYGQGNSQGFGSSHDEEPPF